MFERFTDGARALVRLADEEAASLGHRYLGTEHLLLAMLHEETGTAYRVLTDAGLVRARVRADIEDRLRGTALGEADAEALQSIGIDLPAVRAKIEELFGPGALDPPQPAQRRRGLLGRRRPPAEPCRRAFTGRAKKVLELSLREAVRLGHSSIGSEHVLLGLLREGEGLAAKALTDAGLSLDDLRARTIAALDQAA